MRRCYAVQITEGKGTEFLWQGQALGDGHAVSLAVMRLSASVDETP